MGEKVIFSTGQFAGHNEGVSQVLPFSPQFEGDKAEKAGLQTRDHASVYKRSDQAACGRFFEAEDPLDIFQAKNQLVVFMERCDKQCSLGA